MNFFWSTEEIDHTKSDQARWFTGLQNYFEVSHKESVNIKNTLKTSRKKTSQI